MRVLMVLFLIAFLAVGAIGFFHLRKSLPGGLDFRGPERIVPKGGVGFFADVTGRRSSDGREWTRRQIFDEAVRLIEGADAFVVADFFLINEFAGGSLDGGQADPTLSQRFVDALESAARRNPEMPVILITDPINTVYGGVEQPLFDRLRTAGVEVVLTDLSPLRDSNLLYSPFWRACVEWWGGPENPQVDNPIGEGRIRLGSFLKLLNFKANHRKVLITGDSDGRIQSMVTSANPHSASARHGNVALVLEGAPAADLLRSEEAVYRFSTGRRFPPRIDGALEVTDAGVGDENSLTTVVLTEKAIKRELLDRIERLEGGDKVDVAMFYLSDFDLREALAMAEMRGASVRLLLDPNKDAFGREKNGIPNRQTGSWLSERGVEVRWYQTSGEQFHSKMALFRYGETVATLVLGSANWTRRNLENLNLETCVSVSGPLRDPLFREAEDYFDFVWSNAFGRTAPSVPNDLVTSAPFSEYRDTSLWKRILYRVMEATGASTF